MFMFMFVYNYNQSGSDSKKALLKLAMQIFYRNTFAYKPASNGVLI